MEVHTDIRVLDNEEKVTTELCSLVEYIANTAIEADDIFKIGLSGGSIPALLAKGLSQVKTDWSKWRLFFCDERVVPFESTESTFGVYKTFLIGNVPLTEDQFIKIDPHLTAEEAAKDYIQKMAVYFPPDCLPRFHLLLLGMGPDGHTCSLFPGHRLLEETSVWIAPITNSPKPPASRITLTFPVINNAEACIFVAMGSSKAETIKRVFVDKEPLPATRVRPMEGLLYWLLDKDAAALLKKGEVNNS
ncbi:hypothetical protein R5R35_006532 [Gryllus longicercus]|uniref:6-phosphogluconolactonase n=1 Tax=Gryllus longicercus TaxID=2509291 RepID=A0AAN9V022_9ORTH